MKVSGYVHITPEKVDLNGKILNFDFSGAALTEEIYRREIGGWPKFYKMDPLSRLGFVASELLLGEDGSRECSDRAVVLFGSSSSLCDDLAYQETIEDRENYYPSPAVFVYTLPNIVTGEIAIKRKYYGETSFFVLDRKDPEVIIRLVNQAFADPETDSVLAGWLDSFSPREFEALLFLAWRDGEGGEERIKELF